MSVLPTAPPPGRIFAFDQPEACSEALLPHIAFFPTSRTRLHHPSMPQICDTDAISETLVDELAIIHSVLDGSS